MIEIQNVSFRYNRRQEQISGLSLNISEGEFAVLTGPSGCGKTTLTRIINGLIPHFYEGSLSGEVRIDGKNAGELHPWEFGRIVGSVFQDPRSQFFAAVVQDEVAFCCENYGVPPRDMEDSINEISNALNIKPLLSRQLLTLSSGEKQKVAVASAAVIKPAIYVLDEPSANLDMSATLELAKVLEKIKREGSTVIIAEHRLYYLTELADRFLYMNDGKIENEYTPGQMKAMTECQLSGKGLRGTKLQWSGQHDCFTAKKAGSRPAVSARSLSLKAGVRKEPLLSNISFDIYPGEIVAMTGSNGVGKTTLARALCGLVRESNGRILFDGSEARYSARYKKAWFVMQDADCQLFSESVIGEMTIGRKASPDMLVKAEEILRGLDLWEYRDRHPASLSGGQKQRLTLAVALVQDTPVLILDEPTSGLDGKNLEKVVQCLKKQAEAGKAVLVITHDHELVQKTCTRMLHLDDGSLSNDFCLNTDTFKKALECMIPEN